MVTNYYTLAALADAWSADLAGYIVGDVYSQSKDELTIALASSENTWMLRVSTHPGFKFIFRNAGYNKARRNVATLFPQTLDKKVADIRLAQRDRVLFIDFTDGSYFQFILFGPRANVLYVDNTGAIVDAFQRKEELKDKEAPASVPAPLVDTPDVLTARWRTDRKSTVHAITAAFPFFNADLSREVAHRAGALPDKPADCTPEDLQRIFDTAEKIAAELSSPLPRIYWRGHRVVQFSLAALHQDEDIREETFESIDKAVGVYVKRRLGQRAFDLVYTPLEKALRNARDSYAKRLDTMLNSLTEESRADKYERWGHLLMAAQASVPKNVETVTLEDLFADNQPVTIALDPQMGVVENAQRYYEKARKNRQARSHAEERLELTERQAKVAAYLFDTLSGLTTKAEVTTFEKEEAKRLAMFLGHQTSNQPQIPFRRYTLAGGYEVWVGKNAKQNDALTFKYARKFDYWLHARGVPGSHTVLRRPGRTAQTPKQIMEAAASIAAYHSKARGSHLVPVIITERKYVRKPRGAAVGSVIVEKEQVLLVEPGIPE